MRQVQGPVEQRLSSQDEKIQSLEEKMQTLMATQDTTQKTLQGIQEEQKGVETRLTSQLLAAVESVKCDLSTSFAGAIAQQSAQFDQNLRELKNMIANSKRKTAEKADDDMSS